MDQGTKAFLLFQKLSGVLFFSGLNGEAKESHMPAPLSTLGRAQAADEGRSAMLHESLLTTAGLVGAVESIVIDSTVLQ